MYQMYQVILVLSAVTDKFVFYFSSQRVNVLAVTDEEDVVSHSVPRLEALFSAVAFI